MYIDSHAHLTSEALLEDVDQVLERAMAVGIKRVVNICTDQKSLETGLALRSRYPYVFNAAALTPHDAETLGETFFSQVAIAAQEGHLIALGETGLDYCHVQTPRSVQIDYLLRYFELAKALKLPLIFHCREAFQDLFKWADQHYLGHPAILHCFTGNADEAKAVIDRGWHLSISGIITFKKSDALRQAVKALPLERLLIETDAPYLAPQGHRGQRNEPAWVVETAATLGTLYDLSGEEMGKITAENAENFFSFF